MLEMLVRGGMLRKLRRPVCRALIAREWHLRGLRSRPSHSTRTRSRRHGHAILWPWPLRRDHLVRVVEPRGSVPRHAVEHALELARILRRRGCMEKGGRGVYGRWIKSPIILARKIRGVDGPGVHVVRFYQPICLWSATASLHVARHHRDLYDRAKNHHYHQQDLKTRNQVIFRDHKDA